MGKTRINIYSVKQVKEKGGLYDLEGINVNSPADGYGVIQTVLDLNNESVEKFGILNLNTRNKISGIHVISVGTLNSTMVHPREVFKAAMLNNSASIILFHNHPSGDPTPSAEDITLTKRLVEAGKIMGIQVLDHLIVGDGKYCSIREAGIWNWN